MPENRKYYPHNSTLFITSRTEEGLPLIPTLVMNFIIWGILARARDMYKVRVCHFLFMSNHFHMILVVDNPGEVSEFIGYVKCEIAHAVNRLLGRRKRTIWCDGYDSPIILTADDVLKYIRYLYLNPAKADLVENIEDYPGVSSWEMFVDGRHRSKHKRLSRPLLKQLPLPALSVNEQKRMLTAFKAKALAEHEFVLEPFAWMECFPGFEAGDAEVMKRTLISEIREDELKFSANRKREKKGVLGATKLRRQSMLKEHEPKRFSRRMICLCSDVELRRSFIGFYKELCAKAREVYECWKKADFRLKIPPGMFSPRVPLLVSEISVFT